jgi:hypothetical protein
MQGSHFSKRVEAVQNCQLRPGSAPLPIFPAEVDTDNDRTDPLASEGPLFCSSEWPTSSELEAALLDADPFPTTNESRSLAGDHSDTLGEFEPPLPRDTLPSPPPAGEEPSRMEIPQIERLL